MASFVPVPSVKYFIARHEKFEITLTVRGEIEPISILCSHYIKDHITL